jgi:hypothetical protein
LILLTKIVLTSLFYRSDSLREFFEHTRALHILKAAATDALRCVEAAPTTDGRRPMYLNNLGALLHKQYEEIGSADDLRLAAKVHQESGKSR